MPNDSIAEKQKNALRAALNALQQKDPSTAREQLIIGLMGGDVHDAQEAQQCLREWRSRHKNCWEHFACPDKERCPAYTMTPLTGLNSGEAAGRICWTVTGTYCGGKKQGSFKEKFEAKCKNCEFRNTVLREEGMNLADTATIYRSLLTRS